MTRLAISLFLLSFILVFPAVVCSQSIRDANGKLIATIENGEVRNAASIKVGSVNTNGEVRDSSGRKLGVIKDGRVLNANAQTIFKYDRDILRDSNGRLIYKIGSDTVRNATGQLLLKYEKIELIDRLAFLCFFYTDS